MVLFMRNKIAKLIAALGDRNIDEVQKFLAKGLSPNLTLEDGEFLLYKAVVINSLPLVKTLVEKSANINLATRTNETALHVAAKEGYADIVEYLLDKGATVDIKTTKAFKVEGDRTQEFANDSYTPLLWACMNGHKRVVELLIANRADIEAICMGGSLR